MGGTFIPVITFVAVVWALVDVSWSQHRARRTGASDIPPRDPGSG